MANDKKKGNVGIKCRFAARGFNGKFQDLDTYAGTISRSGQGFVNAVVADKPGFVRFSFDINHASQKD